MWQTVSAPVQIVGMSLLCPSGHNEKAVGGEIKPGDVPNFSPKTMIPDRKNIKLMTHAVQLGVATIAEAVSQVPYWNSIPPERRGMYVGASPQVGKHEDLYDAIEIAYQDGKFSLSEFGSKGIPLIHPLWLVRGLSNNVLGFSSAHHDIQGHNMSYAMGEDGGWNAIVEGIQALCDGRVDIVVVGGSDDLLMANAIVQNAQNSARKNGETISIGSAGAAFFVLQRAEIEQNTDSYLLLDKKQLEDSVKEYGLLGASAIPVALALQEFSKRI